MHFHSGLPFWFLVVSLFLPRIALFVGWLEGWSFFVPQIPGIVLWVLLPRVLVLFLIHHYQGLSDWFWLHLVVALIVWSGSSWKASSSRR